MSEAKSVLDLPDAAQRLAGLTLAQGLICAVLEDRDVQFHAHLCVESHGAGHMIWLDAVKARRLPRVLWDTNNREGEDFAVSQADISGLMPASRVEAGASQPFIQNQDHFCRRDFPKRLQEQFHRFLDLLRNGDLLATGFEVASNRTVTIDAGVWRSHNLLLDLPGGSLRGSMMSPTIYEDIALALPASAFENERDANALKKDIFRGGKEKYPWDQVAILFAHLLITDGWPAGRADAIRRVRKILEHCREQGLKFEGGDPKDDTIVNRMTERLGPVWTCLSKGNKKFRIEDVLEVPPLDGI